MKWIREFALIAVGVALGAGAVLILRPGPEAPAEPDEWLARVGDQYVTQADFENAMRRSGSSGQFHDAAAKRALLDRLLFDRALVQRALDAGIHREPEIRRSRDRVLINRVIRSDLRPRQERIEVEPAAIREFFEAHAGEYRIPSRRRVAMLFFELGDNASDETRARVRERAEQARYEALQADTPARDFGALAREYSEHQASRYRGGVLGWITDGDLDRYSYPRVVMETAQALSRPGEISEIVADEQGLYVVRLVDHEPQRERTLEELESGIRQRLLRSRYQEVEQAFREETLAAFDIRVREDALERVAPPGPRPGPERERRPPSLPAVASQGGANR